MHDKIDLIIRIQGAASENGQASGFDWITGADALMVDPANCDPQAAPANLFDRFVLLAGDPERDRYWNDYGSCQWVCDQGLTKAAELRDDWPDLDWIPRLDVYRPEMSYRFSGPAVGEGFSFYIPDTSIIKGWEVTDERRNLTDALRLACELGFTRLWLHSLDAEDKGRGLDLEMLEKAAREIPDIWVSGGLTETRHLSNLAKWGGATGVITDQAYAETVSVERMRSAIRSDPCNQVAPELHFG